VEEYSFTYVVPRERYEKNTTDKPDPRNVFVCNRVGQREVCNFLPMTFHARAGFTAGRK
jgi:hypothetical protein